MNKKYKFSLITIFTTALAILLTAVCLLTARPKAAFASARYVTVDGSNVFYTTIRGAEVTDGVETDPEDEEKEKHFTLFKIGHNETVAYRKSLAYSWIAGEFDEKGNPTGAYNSKSFTMTIGFDKLNFEKYIITFQSQQYLKSDDKISNNYLIFVPGEDGKVNIATAQTLDEELYDDDYHVSCPAADHARIEISFAAFDRGEVSIGINGETNEHLTFKNVYYPYANYVSSGDNAVTPLTFTAKFDEDAKPEEGEGELTADMKLYELNGQSFELNDYDNDGIYSHVIDEAAPALCFTKTPSFVQFGKSLDFSYQVIDVLATSPRATANFYVLTGDQYAADDFDYMQIEYEIEEEDKKDTEGEEGEGEGEEEGEKKEPYTNPFINVSSGSDIRVIRDANTFVPSKYLEGGSAYNKDFSVYGLIKIYYEVYDVTGSSKQTDKVFVDWYAKEDAIVNIFSAEYKDTAKDMESANEINKGNFLKIIDGKEGISFAASGDNNIEDYKATIKSIEESYQAKIDEAIEKLDDGKLYAGGDSYFYLPAIDELFVGDEYFDVRDYKFSIYYKGKTTGTASSLDFNNLSFPLKDADATYRFTVYITDSFGNPMRYPDTDDDGNLVWKEITSNDIWNEDFALLLPFFEIEVSYKKATAKNPESLSVAYVGTNYSGVSFDIKDSAGTSTAIYNLYIFDRNGAYRDLNINLNYSEFVENYEKLFDNSYVDGLNTRKYFKTVRPSKELNAGDADYDLFKAINWNNSNVTFTPQSVDDFYVVRLNLLDNRSQTSEVYFATVAASIKTTSLKGETQWVQNNLAAIILLSIAGVLFIAFIVLLVVKPKDKGDIDEIYENDKKDKKNKKVKSK